MIAAAWTRNPSIIDSSRLPVSHSGKSASSGGEMAPAGAVTASSSPAISASYSSSRSRQKANSDLPSQTEWAAETMISPPGSSEASTRTRTGASPSTPMRVFSCSSNWRIQWSAPRRSTNENSGATPESRTKTGRPPPERSMRVRSSGRRATSRCNAVSSSCGSTGPSKSMTRTRCPPACCSIVSRRNSIPPSSLTRSGVPILAFIGSPPSREPSQPPIGGTR